MSLSPCKVCGGNLHRSRRTIGERFFSTGAYRCSQCGARSLMTPAVRLKHAHYAKCPKCSSAELSKLRKVDGVDTMQPGLLNLAHRLLGGKLYHCWFCRLQFYDSRPILDGDSDAETESRQTSDAFVKSGIDRMLG